MAESIGIILRNDPKQVFTILFTWNLVAFWRRLRKLQWPWAPYVMPVNRELLKDTSTPIRKYTEMYLRSTSVINPYEPEIVALAVKLGMNEKTKREYAEDAYYWVKNNIIFCMEVPPNGVVNVMKKGYGLCLSKIAVFTALMRVNGIPTRFIEYKQKMDSGFMQLMVDEETGETGEKIAHVLSKTSLTHGCVEFLLDNEWIPADLTWTDEEEVGMDMLITQFGESPFGKFYNIIPDTTSRHEDSSISKVKLQIWLSILILRGMYDRVNERFLRLREIGRKRLEETGREAYIESKRKFYVPPPQLIPYNNPLDHRK
jgi:hypothetical protein